MYVKEVLVQNKAGLHARPATFFIQKANEYKSTVWVEKEERRVNAKSLLGVLSLGIIGGTTVQTKQRLLTVLLLSLSQVLLNKLNNLYSFRI